MNIEALRSELASYLNSTSKEELVAELKTFGFEFEDPWLSEEEFDFATEAPCGARAANSNELALAA